MIYRMDRSGFETFLVKQCRKWQNCMNTEQFHSVPAANRAKRIPCNFNGLELCIPWIKEE